jgi:O-acetyl-ADP-ribose deacetylase (regulator of RNase III)
MHEYQLDGGPRVTIASGDLTSQRVDAIVNAANERMLGGGGVDGAIHAAAGAELLAACRAVPEVRPGVRCPTGEARLTAGFRLPARYVIHTVGPVYRSIAESAPLLAQSHVSSLRLALAHGLRTIAFPAISCGVYGYPLEEAAAIALGTCREHAAGLEEVRFVLYGERAFVAWREQARITFDRSPASR